MNLKNELRKSYVPPDPSKKALFLEQFPRRGLSFPEFVLSQVQYIRRRVWIVSAAVLIAAVAGFSLSLSETLFHIRISDVWIISSIVPYLAMLTALEISRSDLYGMAEMEAACRFSLPQLTGARILILGVVNFTVLSALTIFSGLFTPIGIMKAALYILTPFLLTNSLSLAFCARFDNQEATWLGSAAAFFISAFGLILPVSGIVLSDAFQITSCILICILGISATIFYMKETMNGVKYYGTCS